MALQSSEGQQNSLVFWTWCQLSVACGVFFISKNLDALSKSCRKGNYIQDSSLLHTGAQPSRCPAQGRASDGEKQKSLVSAFRNIGDPSCKGCVTVCGSFSGSEHLERLHVYCPSSTVVASGCCWLCPSLLAWCMCGLLGLLATPLGCSSCDGSELWQERQHRLLVPLCPGKAVWE